MALDLGNLFAAVGRCGRTAYLVASGQSPQSTPFSQLAAFGYINPTWVAPLSQSYDPLIRAQSTGLSAWTQAATTILQQFIAADDPAYGTSLPAALSYLLAQMTAQAATVKACTIGSSVAADAANVGTASIFVTTTRGDGLILQNVIAEVSTLLITADSYTGGATQGREPWQWTGAPNVSSLGTGTPVGLWDWDWPQGSAGSASGNAISASQYATTGGNLLYNSDFATWTGGTPALSYWNLSVGTWGTDVQQGATVLGGTYSVQFKAGTGVNTALTQQFNSSSSSGATAGTSGTVSAYTGYGFNLWLKRAGTVSAGVLTVSLVDGSGTVINDQQGTANSTTISLASASTAWFATTIAFRLPVIVPAIIRLKITMSTALTGADLFMDWLAFTQPTNLYPGGPNLVVFSDPAAPFEAAPDPDGWSITTTNNRGGSTYCATFQSLFNRLFQTPSLILPYDPSPTISDTLITNA